MGGKSRMETDENAAAKKINGFLHKWEIRLFFGFEMNNGAVKPLSVCWDVHLMGNMMNLEQKRFIMLDLFIDFFL